MITRRGLITGISALVAAPALVRAESLMPLRGLLLPAWPPLIIRREQFLPHLPWEAGDCIGLSAFTHPATGIDYGRWYRAINGDIAELMPQQ